LAIVIHAMPRFASGASFQTIEREGFTVRVDPQVQSSLAFALSVAEGLDSRPRRLDASYLYDQVGSTLFERITEQPEYYLTRAEDRLLLAHASTIREVAGSGALVELGSGASIKTQRLLDAWTAAGPATYVPVDVDARAIELACVALRRRYSDSARLVIRGFAATYERALAALCGSSPMTIAFLGSTLGNLGWRQYPEFCRLVSDALAPGDHFLVGLDLVKSPGVIEAAYNDAAGVSAAFTRNLFARMNRELATRIPESAIEHVAYYDPERERVEIFAQAARELSIQIPILGREFRVARGERILTEVSHKFRPAAFIATIERLGLRLAWSAEDSAKFGLFLFSKPQPSPSAPRTRYPLREKLAELDAMRSRTKQLAEPLSEADLTLQHSPLMSPIAWDLGHIAHFEELWLLSRSTHAEAPAESDLYDALSTPRAERSKLPLPAISAVWDRLRSVRRAVEQHWLERDPGPALVASAAGEFAVSLVLQHEAQHQETILQAIALREDLSYRPVFAASALPTRVLRPATESLLVPGGPFLLGSDDREWAYDNERPAHLVTVESFRIARAPVTNAAYLAFMADGGYSRRSLWSEAGWAWLQQSGCRAPAHFRQCGLTFRGLVFGQLEPLHPDGILMRTRVGRAGACRPKRSGRKRQLGIPPRVVRGVSLGATRPSMLRAPISTSSAWNPRAPTPTPRARAPTAARRCWVTCGNGPVAGSRATRASRAFRIENTPRSFSANSTASCAADRLPRARSWRAPPFAIGIYPSGAKSSRVSAAFGRYEPRARARRAGSGTGLARGAGRLGRGRAPGGPTAGLPRRSATEQRAPCVG
jgi:L-histidine N-alpha-methyltransferase